ncbi:hypothetical protein Tco_0858417 [Tanacetum coccineum]|uniref:Uncharacterized protein n=1 Tax=Tanacetum coccineum TaxID=301880 RepID=A0ABQ5B973_9ASTR
MKELTLGETIEIVPVTSDKELWVQVRYEYWHIITQTDGQSESEPSNLSKILLRARVISLAPEVEKLQTHPGQNRSKRHSQRRFIQLRQGNANTAISHRQKIYADLKRKSEELSWRYSELKISPWKGLYTFLGNEESKPMFCLDETLQSIKKGWIRLHTSRAPED